MNEPSRKSYLDHIKANLAAADIDQYLTRFVYIGEFHESGQKLQKQFETKMKNLQLEYSDVPLTGLLLVYPKYFVHIIETSDEMMFRHLNGIFNDEEMSIMIGRLLLLPPCHHVYHFYFPRWFTVLAEPPELFEKLDDTGLTEVERQMTNCLSKIYALCDYISSTANGNIRATEELLPYLRDRDQRYLPESTVIEFLIKSKLPVLRDLREYFKMANFVPHIRLYNEHVWPPPSDFMPCEVFVDHTSRRDFMLKRLSQQQEYRGHMN